MEWVLTPEAKVENSKIQKQIRSGRPEWSQVGMKIATKIDVDFEWRILKNHALPAVRAQIYKIRASKLGVKIELTRF